MASGLKCAPSDVLRACQRQPEIGVADASKPGVCQVLAALITQNETQPSSHSFATLGVPDSRDALSTLEPSEISGLFCFSGEGDPKGRMRLQLPCTKLPKRHVMITRAYEVLQGKNGIEDLSRKWFK